MKRLFKCLTGEQKHAFLDRSMSVLHENDSTKTALFMVGCEII
jgi:hypothetical protein